MRYLILSGFILLLVLFLMWRSIPAHAAFVPGPVCGNGVHTNNPHCSPSPTPRPTPADCDHDGDIHDSREAKECPTTTPTPSMTPAPTATESAQVYVDPGLTPAGPPQAPVCQDIKFAPTITNVGRVDPSTIHAEWSKVDDFVSDYVVQYGLGPIPMWNTVIHGNSTDLGFLPFNHVLWVRAAGTFNGCVGPYGEWIDP